MPTNKELMNHISTKYSTLARARSAMHEAEAFLDSVANRLPKVYMDYAKEDMEFIATQAQHHRRQMKQARTAINAAIHLNMIELGRANEIIQPGESKP